MAVLFQCPPRVEVTRHAHLPRHFLSQASFPRLFSSPTPRTATVFPTGSMTGYTLTELIVALAIVSILSASATGVRELMEKTQVTTAVNRLIASLHLARGEAIKRGSRITLCQSTDQHTCGRTDRWEQGWIVFTDPNNNRQVDGGESTLSVQHALAPGYTARWRGSLGTNYYLSYLPSGRSNKAGTFTFCDISQDHHNNDRTLIITMAGRVRTSTTKADGSSPDCPPPG